MKAELACAPWYRWECTRNYLHSAPAWRTCLSWNSPRRTGRCDYKLAGFAIKIAIGFKIALFSLRLAPVIHFALGLVFGDAVAFLHTPDQLILLSGNYIKI